MSTILPGLIQHISALNKQYTAYPGTCISHAIYEYSYSEQGELISELWLFWQALPMHWGPEQPFRFDQYDNHSGFEEFTCTLVEHFFSQLNLFTTDRGNVERIDQAKINALADILESATSSGDIQDRIPAIIELCMPATEPVA